MSSGRARQPVLRTLSGWFLLLVLGPIVSLVSSQACLSPTQVTVVIDTGATCAAVRARGVTLAVDSEPLAAEAKATTFVTASTRECTEATRRVGSLVITPSDDSSRGAIVVVSGIDVNAESCTEANRYAGCIVSRRQFSFVDHRRLTLPIVLDPACLNQPCSAITTCERGVCVSSETRCPNDLCTEVGKDEGGNPLPFDASGIDSAPPDGASDAGVDAPTESGIMDGGSDVDGSSGADPVPCPTMLCGAAAPICCATFNLGTRSCQTACDGNSVRLRCEDITHCPPQNFCCLNQPSNNGTQCFPATTGCAGGYVCKTSGDCPPAFPNCTGNGPVGTKMCQ